MSSETTEKPIRKLCHDIENDFVAVYSLLEHIGQEDGLGQDLVDLTKLALERKAESLKKMTQLRSLLDL